MRRGIAKLCLLSLRGAEATKQSRASFGGSGLLRGACHRAALCADPLARNDGRLFDIANLKNHRVAHKPQTASDVRRDRFPQEPTLSRAVCRRGKIRRDHLDKKLAGLLGAVAALGTIGTAQASTAPAPTDVLAANSYAELLQPIPDASARLKALDEQQRAGAKEGGIQLAHRHHHHHHHYGRRRHHHHHHHHHG
jgi:hypothetical protein